MLKQQQQRYQLFLRVRDFGAQHAQAFPASSTAGQAFATVTEAIAAIDQQSTARLVSTHAGKKALAAARKDVRDRLNAIARTAGRIGKDDPAARGVFQLPERRSDHALLETARTFIRDGEAVSAQWVALGLPETTIPDLTKAVEALEQAVNARRQGQSGVKTAASAVVEALERGFEAVRELDVLVANTFEPDSLILAEWTRERRVQPARRVTSEEIAEPAATPVVSLVAPTPSSSPAAAPATSPPTGVVAIDDEVRRAS